MPMAQRTLEASAGARPIAAEGRRTRERSSNGVVPDPCRPPSGQNFGFGKRRYAVRAGFVSTDDEPEPRAGPQPLAFRASALHVVPAALNAGLLVSSEFIWLTAAAGLAAAVVGSG